MSSTLPPSTGTIPGHAHLLGNGSAQQVATPPAPLPDGYVPVSMRGPPTTEQLMAEFNRPKPAMPPRPKFDLGAAHELLASRIVTRDAAQAALDRAVAIFGNAEAAVSDAADAANAFSGLEDAIAETFAAALAAGRPPTPTGAQQTKRAEQREADRHLAAVCAAQVKIQADLDAARAALAKAEDGVAHAAVGVIRCEGEVLAERCAELRAQFIEARNELMNIGSVRLRDMTITPSPLWMDMAREPLPEASPDAAGVREWNAKARRLTGHA